MPVQPRGRWWRAITPAGILERRDLRPGPKLLYGVMAFIGRRSGACYASESTLGEVLVLSKRTIRRYLRQLSAAGCVVAAPRPGHPTNYFLPQYISTSTPANEGGQVWPELPRPDLAGGAVRTVHQYIDLPLGIPKHKRACNNKISTSTTPQVPDARLDEYQYIVDALKQHAEAIGRTDELRSDEDLLRRLTVAAQGHPKLAAHLIDEVSRRRFGRAPGKGPAWPASLGYWITVVREEAAKYLARPKTR